MDDLIQQRKDEGDLSPDEMRWLEYLRTERGEGWRPISDTDFDWLDPPQFIPNSRLTWRQNYEGYLLSAWWRRTRGIAIYKAHNRCTRCAWQTDYKGTGLEVHHKTYKHLFNELPEELEVLCKACHEIADQERAQKEQARRHMRMNWFRLYNEARNDAKLRTLTDGQFRVWFNLLCLASEQHERGTIEDYDKDLLCIEVAAGDDELLSCTLKQLERLRIITNDGTTITFRNFLDRQYDKPSDRPEAVKERVTRHRETLNKEGVTRRNAKKRGETHIQEDSIQEENIQEEIREEDIPPNPPPAYLTFDAFWEDFKKHYPAREGRREGIDTAAKQAARALLAPGEWASVTKGRVGGGVGVILGHWLGPPIFPFVCPTDIRQLLSQSRNSHISGYRDSPSACTSSAYSGNSENVHQA